jgi:hypothetical protein
MTLQYFDTNSTRSDIPHNTGSPMIVLVRHSLVNGTYSLNVYIVAEFVRLEVGRCLQRTMASKRALEQIPCVRSVPVRMWHTSLKQTVKDCCCAVGTKIHKIKEPRTSELFCRTPGETSITQKAEWEGLMTKQSVVARVKQQNGAKSRWEGGIEPLPRLWSKGLKPFPITR